MSQDLKQLLKRFGVECEAIPLDSKQTERKAEETKPEKPLAWPPDMLPVPPNTDITSVEYLSTLEDIEVINVAKIKKKKLISMLHKMDIELLRKVPAKDLVIYDGSKVPDSISHLLNKNIGMLNWLSNEARFRHLLKMIEHAALMRSYNNLNILIKAAQSKKLTKRRIESISFYKEKLDNQVGGIFPFEWMLEDCANSNVNVDSEIAARRFCKIMEKFKKMKLLGAKKGLKEREKRMLYSRFWEYLYAREEKTDEKKVASDLLYLAI